MEANTSLFLIIIILLFVIIRDKMFFTKKFSIKEIERFLRTKSNLEDALSKLNEENIIRSNSGIRCEHCYTTEYVEEDNCLLCEKKIN